MLGSSRELHAKLDALSKSQAVIEFNLDGTIITANENFLAVLGYKLEEIQGKHHSMFAGHGLQGQRRVPRVLGQAAARASSRRANTCASPRAERSSGSRRPTIRCSAATASRTRSSSLQATSPPRRSAAPTMRGRSTPSTSRRRSSSSISTARSSPPTRTSPAPSAIRSPKSAASITACSCRRRSATAPTTGCSGSGCAQANTRPATTNVPAKAASASGCRPPTTRSWMPPARSARS